jgi:putative DNA primase/helicase
MTALVGREAGPTEDDIVNPLADKELSDAEKRAFLVNEVMTRLQLKTLEDTDEILYYEGGIYCKGAEARIVSELQRIGGYEITNSIRSEVLAAIRAQTYVSRDDFDRDTHILNVKNGLLNVETGLFISHTPNYLSLSQLPVAYNPKASCPNITKFLASTLDNQQLKTVVRMFGYTLLRSARYEKAFMLTGEGSNGKSVLIKLLVAFVGKENASNVSLQELTTDRFASSKLFGKMVNVFSDLKADRISDSGYFKVLVSGDRMMAQKKHQEPFEFENYAKLVFSANQIPETDDKSYAYFRRWVIIPFNKTFEGEAKDENLIEKLTAGSELSGLLNVALVGLRRLKAERGFDDIDLDEIRRQYEVGASKIQGFLEECCIIEPDNNGLSIATYDLQGALSAYCKEKGSEYVDSRKFGEKLKALGVRKERKRRRGPLEYRYFGIQLKEGCSYVPNKSLTTGYNGNKNSTIGGKEGALQIGTQEQQTLGGASA